MSESAEWVWILFLDFPENISTITIVTVIVPPSAQPGAQQPLLVVDVTQDTELTSASRRFLLR